MLCVMCALSNGDVILGAKHVARLRKLSALKARPGGHAVKGCGCFGARTDTTQQSGQTPDKQVQIKNVTVYITGYAETDTTGMLSP